MTMLPDDTYAVVLAGGRGTRFWPLSRRTLPKQCLSVDGGPTLIERAVARAGVPVERVFVITGPDMEAAVRAAVSPGARVVVEPSGRNTAPAIAWGAELVRAAGGRRFVVLPSDHLVADEANFRVALAEAVEVAHTGALVTLGVRPTRPETGFGWIEPDPGAPSARAGGRDRRVARFVEKPPLAVAEALLAGGTALWNAGMFAWRVDALLDALAVHLPRTRAALDALAAGGDLAEAWAAMDATSIDYGVMERHDDVRVVPLDVGWSDVGSWTALDEVLPAAEGGVAVAEHVVAVGSARNIVHAPGKLAALLGVEGLLVVDTPDALMVARRDDAQAVRTLLEEVERRGLGRYT
jgi:mannose-1-phosphate guanylyltransferase/mannose-6-phosphate isomerase